MFFYKFLMQNRIIRHCKSELNKFKSDKEYKKLIKERYKLKVDGKSTKIVDKKINEIKFKYCLDKSSIYDWSKPLQYKYSKYISSQMANAICDDVLKAIEKVLYSNGKTLHYKKLDYIRSVSAKSLTNGFKFLPIKEKGKIIDYDYNTIICPNNVKLHFTIDEKDNYEVEAFKPQAVKYIRITRRIFNNKYHYYIQFITKGIPPLKLHKGTGNIGIDPGVSSVAIASDDMCLLEDLNPLTDKYNKGIVKEQRSLERKNRQNNPDCFNKDGTIKKGSKLELSKNAKKTKRKLRALYRQKSETLKHNQNRIGNEIIKHCDNIYCEEMNYKALQAKAKKTERSDKESEIKNKDGTIKKVRKFKRKKRFGKSLQSRAPAQFLTLLETKCVYYEIPFVYIDTKEFKASQYNHQTDDYVKKDLKTRWNILELDGNEIKIQRDLYSAFLIKNSDSTLKHVDNKKCEDTFSQFVKNHNQCIEDIKTNKTKTLSSFGF